MNQDKHKYWERRIFIGLIIVLVLYGLKDLETAERLIRAVTEAFTILLNTITP